MIDIVRTADGISFTVHVQPRSSKMSIVGSYRKALKIKLTAPPVGGAANKQCIQLLAKTLGLPKSTLTITTGQTSRLKQIRIRSKNKDFTPSELRSLKNKLVNLSKKTLYTS